MARWRRIIHCTDFSWASGRALTKALEVAKESRAELVLLHVLQPVTPGLGYGYVLPSTYAAFEGAARQDAQARLARLVKRAQAAKVRARSLLLTGIPDEQIVKGARGADLIVMATHGRRGLPRLFLGSVAARVVAQARCPVLTVRGR